MEMEQDEYVLHAGNTLVKIDDLIWRLAFQGENRHRV